MITYTKSDLWKLNAADLMNLCDINNVQYDPDNMNRKEAIANLIAMQEANNGLIDPAEKAAEPESKVPSHLKGKEYVDIVFHAQEGQTRYVTLGLNGNVIYAPREQLVRIPAEYMNVIRDAVTFKPRMETAPDGRILWKRVPVPTYSYEIVSRGRF